MDKGSKPILYIALAVLALFAVWWMLRMLNIGNRIANTRLPPLPQLPNLPHLPKLPHLPALPSKWPNLPQRPPPSTQPSQPAQQPEVFWVRSEGATPDIGDSVCAPYGAVMATLDQLQAAVDAGGNWCVASATGGSALSTKAYWPNTSNASCGGLNQINSQDLYQGQPLPSSGGVNCYGVKPAQGDVDTNIVGGFDWSNSRWSMYDE